MNRPLSTRTLGRCLSCGCTRLRRLAMRYEFRGSFPLVECEACRLRFLAVQPDGAALAELYSAEYFERDFRCGRSESSYADASAFRAENAGLLDAFDRLRPPDSGPRRLLEVGCAGGWLLQAARERGWEVQGVELSADAVARARGLGLEIFHGDLTGAAFAADRFDLVYLGDVLEHVPDAPATVREIARVLRPGGRLYLRGPITTHSLARALALAVYGAFGRALVLGEPPYHLWEFTPDSLRRMFERAGLSIENLRQSKIAPGGTHGRKTALQRAVMFGFDLLNWPLTRWLNLRGDRIVVVARRA